MTCFKLPSFNSAFAQISSAKFQVSWFFSNHFVMFLYVLLWTAALIQSVSIVKRDFVGVVDNVIKSGLVCCYKVQAIEMYSIGLQAVGILVS